jgi:hypothetical protein
MRYRRAFRWTILFAALIAVGYGVHRLLPPAPRCVIDVAHPVGTRLDSRLVLSAVNQRPIAEMEGQSSEFEIEGPIHDWDTRTGAIRASYFHGNRGRIWAECDSRFLAVELAKGRFLVIDVVERNERTVRVDGKAHSAMNAGRNLSASPDGRFLAFETFGSDGLGGAQGFVSLVEADEDTPLFEKWVRNDAPDLSLFTPDGRSFIYSQAAEVIVWDLVERKEKLRLAQTRGPLRTTSDGRKLVGYLLAPHTDRAVDVAVWEIPNFKPLGTIKLDPRLYGTDVLLSKRGNLLMLTQSNSVRMRLDLWNLDEWKQIAAIDFEDRISLRLCPDENSIAVNTPQDVVMLDAGDGHIRWRKPLPVSPKSDGRCCTVMFAEHCSLVLLRNSGVSDMPYLDLHTGEERGRFNFNEVDRMAVGFLGTDHDNGSNVRQQHSKATKPAPGRFVQLMARWIPQLAWENGCHIAHVPSGEVAFQMKSPEALRHVKLYDDGTLLTVQEHGKGFRYQFWDVPSPPRWNWILGVPAGLLAAILFARYLVTTK